MLTYEHIIFLAPAFLNLNKFPTILAKIIKYFEQKWKKNLGAIRFFFKILPFKDENIFTEKNNTLNVLIFSVTVSQPFH